MSSSPSQTWTVGSGRINILNGTTSSAYRTTPYIHLYMDHTTP